MEEGYVGSGSGLLWRSLGGSRYIGERITNVPFLTAKPWWHGYRCQSCSLYLFNPNNPS